MGWGRDGESFRLLEAMGKLGGEDRFRLGDQDLALHLRRNEWLQQGIRLSEVDRPLAPRLWRALSCATHERRTGAYACAYRRGRSALSTLLCALALRADW